jgi:hypothetical protein
MPTFCGEFVERQVAKFCQRLYTNQIFYQLRLLLFRAEINASAAIVLIGSFLSSIQELKIEQRVQSPRMMDFQRNVGKQMKYWTYTQIGPH